MIKNTIKIILKKRNNIDLLDVKYILTLNVILVKEIKFKIKDNIYKINDDDYLSLVFPKEFERIDFETVEKIADECLLLICDFIITNSKILYEKEFNGFNHYFNQIIRNATELMNNKYSKEKNFNIKVF